MRERLQNPHEPKSRIDRIHDEILDRICFLHYRPGTPLGEIELANEFGVSRTPIRQVLQRLQNSGLIEIKQGVGSIVTSPDFNAIRDLYEVRMKIVELIGEMSPRPCTKAGIASMSKLLVRAKRVRRTHDYDEFGRISHAFHNELGNLIGNQALRRLYDQFYFQTTRFWFGVIPEIWKAESEAFCVELTEIIRALRAGDIRAVSLIRRNYISLGLSRIAARMARKHDPDLNPARKAKEHRRKRRRRGAAP